ncbi:hypothetical protein [Moorena sp. SIO4G3]|uniref:hypothetical protein n=1 Tax=Moorena sp. SIO4G3 TaxID=2607821 RepID=UPI00142CC637|nr:hypothetical protein [Moorena sp. SIO4G3]NEO82423.1 hypothetical protein [Moorena sp. SIO4G3]
MVEHEVIGVRSLVAQMFSFLETTRLQGSSAINSLCELLSNAGRDPPGLPSTKSYLGL